MSTLCPLGGKGVLVTRPAARAERLCRLIEGAGGTPVSFPTMEILPSRDPDAARQALAEPCDIAIFISSNAVAQAQALLSDAGVLRQAQLAAVGRATAEAMSAAGLPPQLVPSAGFDSESLLALPALREVQGRRVLIVRGEGGRALLGDTLRERGAEVRYAEVYRRAAPDVDVADLLPQWRETVGFVTATSDEVLTNLFDLLPARAHPWLLGLPLAVMSERNAATAMGLGFRVVAVAPEASDEGLCDALCRLSLAAAEAR